MHLIDKRFCKQIPTRRKMPPADYRRSTTILLLRDKKPWCPVRQMMKCQWWCGGLVCTNTICCPSGMTIHRSQNKILGIKMAVILFLNSFVATDVQKWVRSFETSATAYQSRRGHVPEALNLRIMCGFSTFRYNVCCYWHVFQAK
jgi:hypothetical protein